MKWTKVNQLIESTVLLWWLREIVVGIGLALGFIALCIGGYWLGNQFTEYWLS